VYIKATGICLIVLKRDTLTS